MILANQLITLESLVDELQQSSLAHLLQLIIDADILPVVPVAPDWHVFLVGELALSAQHSPKFYGAPKHPVLYIESTRCIELSKHYCTQLIQDGQVGFATVEFVYCSLNTNFEFSKLCANQLRKISRIDSATISMLRPRFAIFNELNKELESAASHLSLEDFNAAPGINVQIDQLRLLKYDAKRIKTKFLNKLQTPTYIDISGNYISTQFRQLLKIFNTYQIHVPKKLESQDTISSYKTAIEQIQKSLIEEDKHNWGSETLRKIAIELIFPRPEANSRSKTRVTYGIDGISVELTKLIKILEIKQNSLATYKTENYKTLLISELSFTEKKAKALTTVIRLTPSTRGGRRAPK